MISLWLCGLIIIKRLCWGQRMRAESVTTRKSSRMLRAYLILYIIEKEEEMKVVWMVHEVNERSSPWMAIHSYNFLLFFIYLWSNGRWTVRTGPKDWQSATAVAAVHGSTLPFLFHKYIYYNTYIRKKKERWNP